MPPEVLPDLFDDCQRRPSENGCHPEVPTDTGSQGRFHRAPSRLQTVKAVAVAVLLALSERREAVSRPDHTGPSAPSHPGVRTGR